MTTPTKSKVSNFECQMTDDRCQTSDACNGCQTSDIKHCTSRLPYHLLPTQLTRVEGVWCHKSKSLGWLWKHGVASIDPNVIDIPTPSELRTKAKLTLLSSISRAQYPLISELQYWQRTTLPRANPRLCTAVVLFGKVWKAAAVTPN